MIRTTLAPGIAWPYGPQPVIVLRGQAKRDATRRRASTALLAAIAQKPGISTAELAKAVGISNQHTWFCTTMLIVAGRLRSERVQIGKKPPCNTFYVTETT